MAFDSNEKYSYHRLNEFEAQEVEELVGGFVKHAEKKLQEASELFEIAKRLETLRRKLAKLSSHEAREADKSIAAAEAAQAESRVYLDKMRALYDKIASNNRIAEITAPKALAEDQTERPDTDKEDVLAILQELFGENTHIVELGVQRTR